MDDIQTERDFYYQQCDKLGGRILQLQKELNQVYTDARRSHTTTSLILKTYDLINHNVAVEEIGKRFLQVILSTMWVDRALVLLYDEETGTFTPQYSLGLERNSPPLLKIDDTVPEFLFVNSNTESTSVTVSFCKAIESQYFIWVFNRFDGIALLIGNDMEDRKFRLPFEEKDRDIVESSLSVFIDILKRKEAEKALLKSERRYRNLVQSSPESIFIYCNGKVEFANNAGLKLLGVENQEEVIGRPSMEFIHPEDRERIGTMIRETRQKHYETPLTEARFRRIDGSTIDTEVVAIPFIFQDRSAVQIVAIDVSERKKMERELVKVEKIESLGILAGGIAHDFNNILTGILGNIELAIAYSSPEREEYKFLENAHSASNRAKELTYKLLTFSKGGVPLTESTKLSDIITDSVNFVLSGSSITCDYSLPADLWPVDIDVVQFRQVIENLTINANQAMPNGGVFSIEAENIDEETIKSLPLSVKRYVKLTIKDHGVGISEKDLLNIFDPYFTTKDGGSGLGLATTYSIIKKHNGLITVESEIGTGTMFIIHIPVSKKEPSEVKKKEEDPETGQGKILVMDDDESVRMVTFQMLAKLGFSTVTANDGNETIELFKAAIESGEPFDGVIIDLTIRGGMGGEETISRLLEIDPDIKAIVSSGYSNNPVMANFQDYGFRGIIKKPFNIRELSECMLNIVSD
ncbi:MAG: PAS domain S-box protein [Candidatus Aegiribacteria sp.]|nr:PAS domain S-box protein [Candidatus Aegiribacteria sp.]